MPGPRHPRGPRASSRDRHLGGGGRAPRVRALVEPQAPELAPHVPRGPPRHHPDRRARAESSRRPDAQRSPQGRRVARLPREVPHAWRAQVRSRPGTAEIARHHDRTGSGQRGTRAARGRISPPWLVRASAPSASSIAGLLLLLSACAHAGLGWPAMREELMKVSASPDLMASMSIGWYFGSTAMAAFGAIALSAGLGAVTAGGRVYLRVVDRGSGLRRFRPGHVRHLPRGAFPGIRGHRPSGRHRQCPRAWPASGGLAVRRG